MAVRQAPKAQFNHPEAFRLMPYRCETCGNLEQIWNSRDGVTPFMTNCPIEGCDGLTKHVFPREVGRPEPFSETLPGEADRVFVSMTREDCEKVAADRVEQMKQQGRDPSELTTEHLVHMIDRLYAGGTQPMAVSVEEYDRRNQPEKDPEDSAELEEPFECQEFAKLYRLAGIGQVVVMLQQDDDLNPEVRFYFDPKVDGLGISTGSVAWDNEAYPIEKRKEKARAFFEKVGPETAEGFIGKLLEEIRAVFNDEEGSGND